MRYTKADLWASEECPLPKECSSRRNPQRESCEELNAITRRATLSEHVRLAGTKRQFHALANPNLRPADRAWAAKEDSIFSLWALMANPSLRRADLPDYRGWSHTFLDSIVRRKDLVRKTDEDYFSSGSSRTIWYSLLNGGIAPRTETVLLEKGFLFAPVQTRWAKDSRASADYLEACLNSAKPGNFAQLDGYLKLYKAAAANSNTSIATLLTTSHVSDETDSFIVGALWSREEEATAWVEQNYPELADVPLDWVRATLSQ